MALAPGFGHSGPSTRCTALVPIGKFCFAAPMRSTAVGEYLTPAEIEKLSEAAKQGRWGLREATLIMVAYRHGLRAIEACELEWSQVEFGRNASLHVRRAKRTHPVKAAEGSGRDRA